MTSLFKKIKQWLRLGPKKTIEVKHVLAEEDKAVIRRFASSDTASRAAATEIFDRHLRLGTNPDSCIELQFMSEVCNPVPDLNLRAQLRLKIVTEDIIEEVEETEVLGWDHSLNG